MLDLFFFSWFEICRLCCRTTFIVRQGREPASACLTVSAIDIHYRNLHAEISSPSRNLARAVLSHRSLRFHRLRFFDQRISSRNAGSAAIVIGPFFKVHLLIHPIHPSEAVPICCTTALDLVASLVAIPAVPVLVPPTQHRHRHVAERIRAIGSPVVHRFVARQLPIDHFVPIVACKANPAHPRIHPHQNQQDGSNIRSVNPVEFRGLGQNQSYPGIFALTTFDRECLWHQLLCFASCGRK